MRKVAFIITLTGPSACGKTHITDKIIGLHEKLKDSKINFQPERFGKYTTRFYRENEVIEKIKKQENIDIKYVKSIPNDCDFVYRTYGKEYGLKSVDLKKKLDNNISPIVVINDVRVVEELKKKFPSQVLSLFLFREIINDVETHRSTGAKRGGVTVEESEKRFEKAVALYRIFIENIFVFDRVILNIPREKTGFQDIDIAEIQVERIINGVIAGKIDLNNNIKKGPKLFIVSGNAQSGKDDIVKAANTMGKMQSEPLIKHTTRWQEDSDENEIICKHIPQKDILEQFEKEYNLEKELFEKEFTFKKYMIVNGRSKCWPKYNAKDASFRANCTFEEYCKALFDLEQIKDKSIIKTGIERFWEKLKVEQDKLKQSRPNKKLSSEDFISLRDTLFESNENCLNLKKMIEQHSDEIEIEKGKIEHLVPVPPGKKEMDSYFIQHEDKDYILYENNELFGEPLRYGYEIGNLIKNWGKRDKHLVLTASLPNMFKICREKFGMENVKTVYTYSQISQKEHSEYTDPITGAAKLQNYDDILRYAYHIVDFDYALIFAETSLTNKSGGQKDELVDQMFRLFRAYNYD
jgi:guanylate kinase